jgi:hypothetical protein
MINIFLSLILKLFSSPAEGVRLTPQMSGIGRRVRDLRKQGP